MNLSHVVSIFVVAALVDLSVQWRGNVCSRTTCSYRRIRVCRYRTWRGCCAWKWIWAPNYYTLYYCCPGWTTSSYRNCDRAICNPSCKNGGRCVRPNVCECRDGSIGSTCNTLVCNYQRPCFPGDCQVSTRSNPICTCEGGFQSVTSNPVDWCRGLQPSQKPEIYEVSARFSFYERGTGGPAIEKYSVYVDSTMLDEVDILWTNRIMFNWLNVTASGHYMPPDNYTPPNFIEDYKIGIGRAEVHFLQEKIPFSGSGAPEVSLNITRPCSPDVSYLNPTLDTYYCAISNQTITTSMENGDTVTITFRVESGGYRKLQEIGVNPAPKGTQVFEGRLEKKAMAYKFDFKKPEHRCLQLNCRKMFYMDEDITKEAVTLRWSDWNDTLSGMYRYAWEVFELKVDGNLVLREPDPLGPIHGPVEVNQSSSSINSFSAIYNPPHAGVYSFILEASDKANNSVFIRRIVLYDPTSEVSTDNDQDRRLYVSSANPVGDYTWQQDPRADIEVTWTEHFVNLVHENEKWLNSVFRYPKELEDDIKDIPRDSNKDDHEGERTVNEIANKRGIVKFEIAKAKDSSNGYSQPTVPNESEWIDVFLNDSYTTNGASWALTSADTVTVWVRATDAMGNKKVDRTQVRFDDSPPVVGSNITFQRNLQSHGVPFSSSLWLTALDMQSGIKRIDVFVYETGNNLVNNFTMPFPTISKCDNIADGCYCTPAHACFNQQQVLSISNCRLWVAKDLNESQSVNIRMDFWNMAGLTTSLMITVDNVGQLNGTNTYFGPVNLKTTEVGETTATITWTHPGSCYTRTELWIRYIKDGELINKMLHRTTTSYNLDGLKPETNYTIHLVSIYGDIPSDPSSLIFETKSELKIPLISGMYIKTKAIYDNIITDAWTL